MWDKLSTYFLDVSKYILTGVVISSFFNEFENRWLLYLLGILAAAGIFVLGIYFSKKKDNDK